MTTTGVEAGRAALPKGISVRYAGPADLPETNRLWREAIDDYLRPMGFPPLPLENPGLQRLHAHALATTPERFLVAERQARAVAFGSAMERGPLWFLSMLFVDPSEQARGLGRALLARLLPDDPGDRVLATCTDSAQPVSNGLYASIGIVPRMPMFNLIGRPRPDWIAPALPAGVTGARVEPAVGGRLDGGVVAELGALDRELLGFEHAVDHAYVLVGRPWLFAYRDASGRLVGYGYTGEVGGIGPIAVRDRELLAPVLAHLLAAVVPRGASSVWLPGDADEALRDSIQAGIRIDGFPTILCWSRPFADFTRYVPTSPGLI